MWMFHCIKVYAMMKKKTETYGLVRLKPLVRQGRSLP